ncbi:hypothetical protein [Phenylobacterium sp. J426]|uniref:hypothetical protein n=1 Tax=Phenylobacterium sp. J426 TaxID=2898439 RepID=UPI0027E3AE80|nr:hypothetical protein [Phenylobacterium sp. J426]
MMLITAVELRPKPARGLRGAWSVSVSRRSSSRTVRDGVGVGLAALSASDTRRTGTPTRKIIRPAKTPAAVIRNCFIPLPNSSTAEAALAHIRPPA